VDRLSPIWIGSIAGVCGLVMVPFLGLGLAGDLPIKDGWLMLAVLMAYVAIVAGGVGLLFPRTWWVAVVTAWPLAPVVLPVFLALAAAYLASHLRKLP
jgi:hypothetical protein